MRIPFLIPLSFLLILLSSGFLKPVSLQNDIKEYVLTRSRRYLDDNDIEEVKAQLYSQVDAIFDHLIECTTSEIPLDECRTVAIRQEDRSYCDRDGDNTSMTMQSRYPDRDGGSPDPYGGHSNANRDNDRYNSKGERYLDGHDDDDCEDFYKSSDESGNDEGHDSECVGSNCFGLGRIGGSYPNNYGQSGSESFGGSGGNYPRNNGDSASGGFGGNGDSHYDNKEGDEDCEDFYNGSDCVDDNGDKTDGESRSYPGTDGSQEGVGESGFYPSVEDSKDKNDGSAFYPGTGGSGSGSDIGYREGEIPVEVSTRREIDCLCTDHKCRCKDSG